VGNSNDEVDSGLDIVRVIVVDDGDKRLVLETQLPERHFQVILKVGVVEHLRSQNAEISVFKAATDNVLDKFTESRTVDVRFQSQPSNTTDLAIRGWRLQRGAVQSFDVVFSDEDLDRQDGSSCSA